MYPVRNFGATEKPPAPRIRNRESCHTFRLYMDSHTMGKPTLICLDAILRRVLRPHGSEGCSAAGYGGTSVRLLSSSTLMEALEGWWGGKWGVVNMEVLEGHTWKCSRYSENLGNPWRANSAFELPGVPSIRNTLIISDLNAMREGLHRGVARNLMVPKAFLGALPLTTRTCHWSIYSKLEFRSTDHRASSWLLGQPTVFYNAERPKWFTRSVKFSIIFFIVLSGFSDRRMETASKLQIKQWYTLPENGSYLDSEI